MTSPNIKVREYNIKPVKRSVLGASATRVANKANIRKVHKALSDQLFLKQHHLVSQKIILVVLICFQGS